MTFSMKVYGWLAAGGISAGIDLEAVWVWGVWVMGQVPCHKNVLASGQYPGFVKKVW